MARLTLAGSGPRMLDLSINWTIRCHRSDFDITHSAERFGSTEMALDTFSAVTVLLCDPE